jgi:hypothetical protein
MLNSQNYVKNDQIIRSGEIIAADSNLKDPAMRVYYHQVPGACTFMSDGAQIVFTGGQFSTKNEEIIKYMDSIVDRVGTLVYSRKPGSPISKEETNLALEVAEPAGNSASNTGAVIASPAVADNMAKQILASKATAASAVSPELVK